MGEILQREFSLPVVKVRLVQLGAAPAARIELVVNEKAQQEIEGDQIHTLDMFGFTETSGTKDPNLFVPGPVVQSVASWAAMRIGPDGVLWIQLKKPYGLLGAVPWERHLQPACGIPVLRLPDALPDPETPSSTFHVALCATTAAGEGPPVGVELVPAVARALYAGVGERLRLHVFADLESLAALEADIAAAPLAGMATVYPRESDFDRTAAAEPDSQNPWLRWVRHAMAGRALDAVHFIAHGCALGTEGAILTTSSPGFPERSYPKTLQAGELRSFLTQVGALVVGFTAPWNNYSDFGLLRIVDDLGAVRAGPVLLHDPRWDPGMGALGEAYELLSLPGPRRPPAHPSLVLFAQPRQVGNMSLSLGFFASDLNVGAFESVRVSEAVRMHLSSEETPLWVAAAERYISENEAELFRFRESTVDQKPTSAQAAHYAGVESALRKIRNVVDKHAEELWRRSS